jgi:hypothetical protein
MYVFNGCAPLGSTPEASFRNQVPCSCLGEGLNEWSKLVKAIQVSANSYGPDNTVAIDSTVSSSVELAPYTISRKTTTAYFIYSRINKKLQESFITSGFTVKAVPGQVPKILKWQRGGAKDDIKNVTFTGGASSLNSEFVQAAWNHLRPIRDGNNNAYIKNPLNGIDLIYYLALPAVTRAGELSSMADRFSRDNQKAHINPDAHLLHTLINKGDVLDNKSPEAFLHMIAGSKEPGISTALLSSRLSFPTLHFMSSMLRDKQNVEAVIKNNNSPFWTFYDHMLGDRIMSNFMDEVWSFFKFLRTKITPNQLTELLAGFASSGTMDSVAILCRRIYDLLVKYHRIQHCKKALQELDAQDYNVLKTLKKDEAASLIEHYVLLSFQTAVSDGAVIDAVKPIVETETIPEDKPKTRKRVSRKSVSNQTRRGHV